MNKNMRNKWHSSASANCSISAYWHCHSEVSIVALAFSSQRLTKPTAPLKLILHTTYCQHYFLAFWWYDSHRRGKPWKLHCFQHGHWALPDWWTVGGLGAVWDDMPASLVSTSSCLLLYSYWTTPSDNFKGWKNKQTNKQSLITYR